MRYLRSMRYVRSLGALVVGIACSVCMVVMAPLTLMAPAISPQAFASGAAAPWRTFKRRPWDAVD